MRSGVTSMTEEYRLVCKFKSGRSKIISKKSHQLALATKDQILEEIEAGALAPYWDGVTMDIQSREVTKWKSLE